MAKFTLEVKIKAVEEYLIGVEDLGWFEVSLNFNKSALNLAPNFSHIIMSVNDLNMKMNYLEIRTLIKYVILAKVTPIRCSPTPHVRSVCGNAWDAGEGYH